MLCGTVYPSLCTLANVIILLSQDNPHSSISQKRETKRMHQQNPAREDPVRLPQIARVLAVASGKGGVGKSTVAVNLALALASRGLLVGLLDADVHGPNVPLMLGVRRTTPVAGWSAMLPIGSASGASNPTVPALDRHGIKVMSVGLLIGEDQSAMLDNVSMVGWMVRHLLTSVQWGQLDVLLLDLPPGTSEPQATLMRTLAIDGVLMVVTPQDLALLDSTRAMNAFNSAGVPVIGVVENMSFLICPQCGEKVQIFHRSDVPRAITNGDIPMLAQIPIEPAISKAADTGRPLVLSQPESRQAQMFMDLAQVVAARLGM
jgi:ATP-binding protein involved in chromosome partitioning